MGAQHADANPEDTSENGKHHGFCQKLELDIAACRTDGHSNADFARALCHRYEHDVHHAYATTIRLTKAMLPSSIVMTRLALLASSARSERLRTMKSLSSLAGMRW